METIELRRATAEDASAVADVYLDSFHATYDFPLAHTDDEVRGWIRDHLIASGETWVAAVEGRIVGLMSVAPGELEQLYVSPGRLGRGIGRRLLDLAKERSPGGLALWTFQVNDRARRFYERNGFTAVFFGDGSGNEERQPDVRFVWAPGEATIRVAATADLTAQDIGAIREMLTAAFAEDEHGGFTEDDWQHSLGGSHFIAEIDGRIVGHASVVERTLHVGGQPFRTGYVEAVAVDPGRQRRGVGSALMRAVNALVDAAFELGALGTGSQAFYERLGWEIWQGPSSVRTATGEQRTPEEDGYILLRRTRSSRALRATDPISCEWRPGDVW